jgi:hypothetical protein
VKGPRIENNMSGQLVALFTAFRRCREAAPGDVASFLRALPEPGVLPSPWDTWTLIGLSRHRARQIWVDEIIRTRLQGAPADLAGLGALAHPEGVPQSGSVPGLPEWEYFFHGRGCCIRHKVDGDAIDVDFWDDSADYFDTFFYKNYLESIRQPELPEQRLRKLYPSARALTIAIHDLLAAGALTPFPGRGQHPYRLADKMLAITHDIERFCITWADAGRRVWLAALIGDWLAADEAATGQPELSAITAPRAERCLELRWCRLRRELENQSRGADALQALADLEAPDLDQCLELALSGPPSGLISAALEILGHQDDPGWCLRVHGLFSRVNPAGPLPEPFIWMTSLKFLLRHGHCTAEVIAALPRADRTELGEAVLMALEHAPELALPLIRKGLLAEVPMARTQVCAILALIGAPWSRRELLRALEASDDPERTAYIRAALRELGDERTQSAVLSWEERNPHEKESGIYLEIDGRRRGPFYTGREIELMNSASWLRHEMDKLRDRVRKVRGIIPPEPQKTRPWWRWWRG